MGPTDRERDATPADTVHLEVTVTRTGGFAGLTRRWRAAPGTAELPRFEALIQQCPWEAPARETAGADRYVWLIWARLPAEEREAQLPDSAVEGPWRELIAEVQRHGQESRRQRE